MKQATVTIKLSLILILIHLSTACSNYKTFASDNKALTKAYRQLQSENTPYQKSNLTALTKSLTTFQQFDDLYGQWLANYHLSNYWISSNNLDRANAFSQEAFKLANILKTRETLFKSTFQVAQLTQNNTLMKQSITYASHSIEKALVLAHLDRKQKAYDLIESEIKSIELQHANSAAYILFQYASYKNLEGIMKLAKSFYVKAGNSNGVIDCLFWLAKYNHGLNKNELANQFALRASSASIAVKNGYKTKAINLWIKTNL